MKRLLFSNSIKRKTPSVIVSLIIILTWQSVSYFEIIPRFVLPYPVEVVESFFTDFNLIFLDMVTTLFETITGVLLGILFGFFVAYVMDRFCLVNRAIGPLLVASQTVPTIILAPILVLLFGYGFIPKIVLVALCCFFPIAVNFSSGFGSSPVEYVNLLKTMGATKRQIFYHLKLPFSLKFFFSGLRISVSYAFVAAVVSEWLGGVSGLGVYMIRAKKSYAFDKMFAAVILVCIVSLILVKVAELFERCVTPWPIKKIK